MRFDPRAGMFKIGRKTKERTLAVGTVKTFAQSLKMIVLAKQLIETDDIATKRKAYYVAKGWADEMRFGEQSESDTVLDDVEVPFSVNREQLGFVPEEKGGEVAGQLIVTDVDRDTGDELAIETVGMFQRLVKHSYWRTANCILISMGGAYAGDPAIHPAAERGLGHPSLRFRRLRSLWHMQHLSYAQGGFRQCGPHQ